MNNHGIEKICRSSLLVLVLSYIFVVYSNCYFRFIAFDYYDWDLAVYSQIVWNLTRGELFSSLLGVNFLGHHAHFLAFLLALVYKLLPHPLILLFLQTVALGFAAVPLYYLSCKYMDCRWALIVCLFYFLYPGLMYSNLYEFHFTSFAPLILFSIFYFFYTEKYFPYLIATILLLLTQENFALLVISTGVYSFFCRRSPRWWLSIIILSCAYLFFCLIYLMPRLNPGTISFISIYSQWGNNYGEVLRYVLANPYQTLHYMFTPAKIMWLGSIFSSLYFIPLISPGPVFLAAPVFLQRLLSNRPQETAQGFHYLAEIFPFIFISFMFGMRRLLAALGGIARKPFLYFFIITLLFFSLVMRFSSLLESNPIKITHSQIIKEQWLRSVSPVASLVTSFEFLSHLPNREHLYSFQYIYSGKYILSNKSYHLDRKVNQALIDFNDRFMMNSFYYPTGYIKIQEFLSFQKFNVCDVADNLINFCREGAAVRKLLFEVSTTAPFISKPLQITIDPSLQLAGVDYRRVGDRLEVDLFWHVLKPPAYDLSTVFSFTTPSGAILDKTVSPSGYRIMPTQSWQSNTWVVEHKYLLIPLEAIHRDMTVLIGFEKLKMDEKLPVIKLSEFKGE